MLITVSRFHHSESVLSASDKRRQSPEEFLEVDEQEFQSVSSLVRGRVRLAEVNQVCAVLSLVIHQACHHGGSGACHITCLNQFAVV